MSTTIEDTNTPEEALQLSFTNTLNIHGQLVRSIDEALEVVKTLAPDDVYLATLMIQDYAYAFLGAVVRYAQKLYNFVE